MQLIIKDGTVIAAHGDHQIVAHLYPGCECIVWDGPISQQGIDDPPLLDPRTEEDKKRAYKDKRRNAYPPAQDQLDMMYHDKVNGATTWVDVIAAVKAKYPKPDKI